MFPVYTPEEARENDRRTIEERGVPSLTLMENAAVGLFEEIAARFPAPVRVLAVCGGGNNGGDGFAAAKQLIEAGYEVDVWRLSGRLTPDAAYYCEAAKRAGARFVEKPRPPYAVAIDALFGTGLTREVEGACRSAVDALNALDAFKIAADVPSGIDAATGRVLGGAVKCDLTVTFAGYKYGLLLSDGRDYTGKVVVRDIGVDARGGGQIVDGAFCRALFPKRKINSHKGTYGSVAVIAGSGSYYGAAVLSASAAAALRAGAGYCYLLCPKETADLYRVSLPEAIVRGVKSEGGACVLDEAALRETLRSADAVALGMGMTPGRGTYEILSWVLQNLSVPVVIDADGLNALARFGLAPLSGTRCNVVLTPHPGEFQRLWGEREMPDAVEAAKAFAGEYGVTVLLKGATSLITDGARVLVNTAGSPALAKGGSGDVLSGVIAALLARGVAPLEAAAGGAYLFGKAGEAAAAELSEYAVLASDVVSYLTKTLKKLTETV